MLVVETIAKIRRAYFRDKHTIKQIWTSRVITGVPSMVFQRQHIVVGAQGEDTYGHILNQVAAGQPA